MSITIQQFLEDIFGPLAEDEVIAISQRPEKGGSWGVAPWRGKRTVIQTNAATYFCISTLRKEEPLRRLVTNVVRSPLLVLDDIGTKIPLKKMKGCPAPHYTLQTSKGNWQWGYFLKDVTPEQLEALIEALIEGGFTDPGARSVHRLVRLPGSVNFKHGEPFTATFGDYFPDDDRYGYAELCELFKVTPREPGKLRGGKTAFHGETTDDLKFTWISDRGMAWGPPNEDGWAPIECPWADEHTDGRRDAKWAMGVGNTGRFFCFHAACQGRTQQDFDLWCKSVGGPDFNVEQTNKLHAIGQKLMKLPAAEKHRRVTKPDPLPPPPVGQPAGDLLKALLNKYQDDVDRDMLPYREITGKGTSKSEQKFTAENLNYVLDAVGFSVSRNQLTGDVELTHNDEIFDAVTLPRERSILTRELLISLCQRCGMQARQKLDEILLALSANRSYHPILKWIEAKPWDGVDRFEALSAALDTPNPDWMRTALKRWSILCIAAWTNWQRETPLSIPVVLVLVGAQNIGKSSFFGSLLPASWRLIEAPLHLDGGRAVDEMRRVLSFGITELSELEAVFSKSDIGALKSFISRPNDIYRLPYDRLMTELARRTAFGASVNDFEFLNDPTGARRFWPIEVTAVNFNHGVDMQQYWAQAYAMFNAGESFNLTKEEQIVHGLIAEEHRVVSHAEGRLEELVTRMRLIPREQWSFMTPTEICRYYMLDNNYMNTRTASTYLRKLFGARRGTNGRRGWDVPIRETERIHGFTPYIPPLRSVNNEVHADTKQPADGLGKPKAVSR